ANQPHTSANAGFELHPWRRLRILESWMTDRYHDAASPLVAEQLLATPPGQGQNALTALNYSQAVNYNQQQVGAFFDVTSRITLRGGYRYVWGDATVLAGQLSQTGPLASASLRRNVALGGFNYRPSERFSMNLDYEGSSSDRVYFRTSLNDYNRGRARARYQVLSSLSFQANFQILNNQNPDPAVRYNFQARDNSLAVYWAPGGGKRFALTGEYDRSTLHSDISYLLPPFLSPAISSYRDNAHTATSAIDLTPPPFRGIAPKLTFGGSLFVSSGSRPSQFYQPMARVSVPVTKHISCNAEWQWYGFAEQFYLYEGFRTHMLLVALRLAR
ncbi:MAG: MtrB/PioB family outer membrane beta-barrel protein, partial [Candidatus Sulfopaludibacter sp.]|nr:MtrB/PioB family outer membrane beta-barrel protein [Candidatus Sulfopaludibacter sp.]